MLNVTLTITAAPELINIMNGFIGALGLKKEPSAVGLAQEVKQPEGNTQQPVQMSYPPVQPAYPQQTPVVNTPNYQAAVPIAQQPQIQTPAATPGYVPPAPPTPQQQAQAPVPNVPTASQTYSMEQLAVAATQIVDAGRRNELVNLLASFGVQALTALPKEQYGVFATQLRAMGAKI